MNLSLILFCRNMPRYWARGFDDHDASESLHGCHNLGRYLSMVYCSECHYTAVAVLGSIQDKKLREHVIVMQYCSCSTPKAKTDSPSSITLDLSHARLHITGFDRRVRDACEWNEDIDTDDFQENSLTTASFVMLQPS